MITIPDYFWERMLDEFARRTRAVEQVCYFDGVRCGEDGMVVALTLPHAQLFRDHFEVSPDAMSQAGKHLRRFQLRRLAQVHTHPGPWVGHSPWDDAKAYSQLEGAVSLVLPNHARARPRLEEAGVHLRRAGGWEQLTAQTVAEVIRVTPSYLDFRADLEKPHEQPSFQPPRKRPWWSVLAFWRD